ncbi:MAG: stage II sporulation protein M [Candidatus Pacearchaeota archaeon]
MLEMLLSPIKAKQKSWYMFFIGLFYGIISVLLARFFFAHDIIMAKHLGIIIVTFSVMFCTPFVYFLFRIEEKKEFIEESFFRVLKEHQKSMAALLFLFLGLLVGYSLMYIGLSKETFATQIETYCSINKPNNFQNCIKEYGLTSKTTGFVTSKDRFLAIFSNNIYVLIFTIIFSLIFGAGGMFVLAWNASVIAAAIGIYTKSQFNKIFLGLGRYMIHGIPEIAAYFFGLLAGGILSIAITKKDYKTGRFFNILQNILLLIILAVIILIIAGFIEVYITPLIFEK